MHTRVAHLPHRSLRYLESGGGRPLVLLHAFPLSADMWLPQLHRVPPNWRFLAPDLRGFRGGGFAFEDPGAGALTMDAYAQDVLALIAHLDLDRAAVAGVSMGGYVAFALLRRAPERITHLVLSNTRATPDTADARAGRDKTIDLVRRDGSRALADIMTDRLLGETSRTRQPDLVDAVRGLIAVNDREGLASALGAIRDRPDSTDVLPHIACPTLVIAGDEDTIIPAAESEAMQRAIPGSRMAVLARTGHLSSLEDPAAWNREVAAFLE